jgi:hypothetical protein
MGVHLAVPTAFGEITTGWPFARISIGEDGVDLISSFPLRSEWYAPLDEITSVKADGSKVRFARADGRTASFRFFSWNRDALVSTLLECGLRVDHIDQPD